MKKICFILSTLQAGGLENYVLRFLKYSEGQYDVTILCGSNDQDHLFDDYNKLGVTIVFKKISYYSPIQFIQFYRFLYFQNFDVICNFSGNFSGPSILISKIAKIPTRIAFYRRSSHPFKLNSLRLIYSFIINKLVYYFSTDILSNSKFAFRTFFKIKYEQDNRFKVIKNGVDKYQFLSIKDNLKLREKYGIPVNAFVIGHVGRFDWSKNHKTMFAVADNILSLYPDVVFVFCGKDTDSEEFKKSLELLDYPDRFFPLGVQDKVFEIYQIMDLFYFPSVTEGQPNALIEAMLTGLPVITSNIEPIKETIPDYAHCNLLDPLNIKKAVELIVLLKNDISKRKEYIHKEWAEKEFDLDSNFNSFRKILEGHN